MRKILFAALALLAGTASASAAHYKALHSFCARTNCADGGLPYAAPVGDGAGLWFGTASGGAGGAGAIYEMRLDGTHWRYTRIHHFCKQPSCRDGKAPYAGLVVDTAGNLYGTTALGGAANKGTAFVLMRDGGAWKYRVLYSFCAEENCADGATPQYQGLAFQGQASGALYDGVSPLYGTTILGGAHAGGTVFALTRTHGHRVFGKLYDFCSQADCADGAIPYAAVTVDASGNTLYGTTNDGGAGNSGTVYRLVRGGAGWSESVVHDFCPGGNNPCTDGSFPQSALLLDGQGNLYGTTETGGDTGNGTVFQISAAGQYTRLHSFCAQAGCADGSEPIAGLTMDAQGRLIGATYQGGVPGQGTVFALSGTRLKTLVAFGSANIEGGYPNSAPALDASGALFGVTHVRGDADSGVFYRLTP